eukprot:TRINITY_DN5390_c0_g1_i1.p1 TRINITY_DN5390_c0_g1~~TRINITY_DN5390_c0_g1_i1.p1  ORF type:complete len:173 (+),score=26.41 TRINITY_DN5390_c0_g1_i1:99-617(+)
MLQFTINSWSSGPILYYVPLPSLAVNILRSLAVFFCVTSFILYEPEQLVGLTDACRDAEADVELYKPMSKLKRLYEHCRLPLVIGPLTLLLLAPTVTMDRAALALGYLTYCAYANQPDWDDVRYVGDRTYFRLSWLPSSWCSWVGWYGKEDQRPGAPSPSSTRTSEHHAGAY